MMRSCKIKVLGVSLFLCALFTRAQPGVFKEVDSLIAGWKLEQAERALLAYQPRTHEKARYYEKAGGLYGVKKEWKPALEFYKKLLALDTSNAEYHFKVGGIYGMIALENKLKALSIIDDIKYHFVMASQLDPEHLESRWALIEFFLELPGFLGGSYQDAYQYAEQLHEISPLEGWLAKGYIEDYKDNHEEALKYFSLAAKYMDEVPDDYPRENIHYQLGKIASRYGLYPSQGIRHLQRYQARYNPYSRIGLEWIYYHMALIYKKGNDPGKAIEVLEKSLSTAPGFKPARRELELLKSL